MAEAEIIIRRRKWTAEEKAALLAEVAAEGGRIATVARRHGLSESLLYNWRSVAKGATRPVALEFQPIGVIGGTEEVAPVLPSPNGHREEQILEIEIELPTGARVRVTTSVSEKQLSRVFRALKGAM